MADPTPAHRERTSNDKLDKDKVEAVDETAIPSVAEEELEPVVTLKTWVVVGVCSADILDIFF